MDDDIVTLGSSIGPSGRWRFPSATFALFAKPAVNGVIGGGVIATWPSFVLLGMAR